eukprot:6181979-Pleurochrysis_carterae.AAC.1
MTAVALCVLFAVLSSPGERAVASCEERELSRRLIGATFTRLLIGLSSRSKATHGERLPSSASQRRGFATTSLSQIVLSLLAQQYALQTSLCFACGFAM